MMTVRKQIPAIWVYTTHDSFNAAVGGMTVAGSADDSAGFLTAQERARVERIRQARMLFRGEHRKYFMEENRTQFEFGRILVNGQPHMLYVPLNVLTLISLKSADLLFGQEPLVRVDDELQQTGMAELCERTNLHRRVYSAAVDCSYEGESFIESCSKDGKAYLRVLDAAEMFPLGPLGIDDQYERYVRRQLDTMPGTGVNNVPAIYLLLETLFLPGSIERRVWQLGEKGEKQKELTLDQWPTRPIDAAMNDGQWQAVTPTGVKENTITWIPNAMDHGQVVSDYDGLIEMQDALNEANTRMLRVLYKHGNPKVFFPTGAADAQGNVRASDDAYYGNPDEKPVYITWDAQLDAASKDRSFNLNMLCIKAETSPVLLGLKEGAAPDAYKKLRLEATNALTKAQRKAVNWKPGIRRALGVARSLEQSTPGALVYGADLPAVEMRDGIPVDEQDQASTLATLRAAGMCSIQRGLESLLGDAAAVAKEKQELKEEAAAATPSFFMNQPAGDVAANEPAGDAADGAEADTATGGETTAHSAPVADDGLNGAQITAAIDVLAKVSSGELSELTAIELLISVGIPEAKARAMVTSQKKIKPPAQAKPGESPPTEGVAA